MAPSLPTSLSDHPHSTRNQPNNNTPLFLIMARTVFSTVRDRLERFVANELEQRGILPPAARAAVHDRVASVFESAVEAGAAPRDALASGKQAMRVAIDDEESKLVYSDDESDHGGAVSDNTASDYPAADDDTDDDADDDTDGCHSCLVKVLSREIELQDLRVQLAGRRAREVALVRSSVVTRLDACERLRALTDCGHIASVLHSVYCESAADIARSAKRRRVC